jgi:hypothetical protein
MGRPARLIVETYSRDFQIIQRFSWNWVFLFKAFTPFISKTLPLDFGEISSRIYWIYSANISPQEWVRLPVFMSNVRPCPSLLTKKWKLSNSLEGPYNDSTSITQSFLNLVREGGTRNSVHQLSLLLITFSPNINGTTRVPFLLKLQ